MTPVISKQLNGSMGSDPRMGDGEQNEGSEGSERTRANEMKVVLKAIKTIRSIVRWRFCAQKRNRPRKRKCVRAGPDFRSNHTLVFEPYLVRFVASVIYFGSGKKRFGPF